MKTRPLGHASATFEKEGKVHILSVFFWGGGGRAERGREKAVGKSWRERKSKEPPGLSEDNGQRGAESCGYCHRDPYSPRDLVCP